MVQWLAAHDFDLDDGVGRNNQNRKQNRRKRVKRMTLVGQRIDCLFVHHVNISGFFYIARDQVCELHKRTHLHLEQPSFGNQSGPPLLLFWMRSEVGSAWWSSME
jgi:hypothetical protein